LAPLLFEYVCCKQLPTFCVINLQDLARTCQNIVFGFAHSDETPSPLPVLEATLSSIEQLTTSIKSWATSTNGQSLSAVCTIAKSILASINKLQPTAKTSRRITSSTLITSQCSCSYISLCHWSHTDTS
ncbi:hypothetical protein GOP47_0009353, partial [Adiantum capillus-veneris]